MLLSTVTVLVIFANCYTYFPYFLCQNLVILITRKTLVVHHANYMPEDNRSENLIPVCTGCHLSYHSGKKGNILIGQLTLFNHI